MGWDRARVVAVEGAAGAVVWMAPGGCQQREAVAVVAALVSQ